MVLMPKIEVLLCLGPLGEVYNSLISIKVIISLLIQKKPWLSLSSFSASMAVLLFYTVLTGQPYVLKSVVPS